MTTAALVNLMLEALHNDHGQHSTTCMWFADYMLNHWATSYPKEVLFKYTQTLPSRVCEL